MYVVTGATGALGRLAVEALLERVPAAQVRATGRRIETLDDLAARGVEVRRADYDDPESLADAFEDATRVLFVSGNEAGARTTQHRAVVDALAATAVELDDLARLLGRPATPWTEVVDAAVREVAAPV
jgi:NAD(P)H dehydrogenase (quinone)